MGETGKTRSCSTQRYIIKTSGLNASYKDPCILSVVNYKYVCTSVRGNGYLDIFAQKVA